VQKSLINQFSSSQYKDAYPDGIELTYWSLARNRVIQNVLQETSDLFEGATPTRIIDIGCGRGIVVHALRAAGIDAWGCEIGLPLIPEPIRPYILTGCDYKDLSLEALCATDTVLLLDVIEHIEDPVKFLAELRECMPKLRRLVITVPARQELWSNYDEYYGHYRRYDRKQLQDTLHAAGYFTKTCRYFFNSLYPAAWLLMRTCGRRKVEIAAPQNTLMHRLIAAYFFVEYRMLKNFKSLRGTSLIAVAELRSERKG
jgi:SAM-dependent methyltransferase